MQLDQAIRTALEYENRVRDTYRAAAAKVGDPVGQKVLELLAKEEQGHVDYLQVKLTEWQRTGTAQPTPLETVVPSREALTASVKRLKDQVQKTDRSGELEILKQALAAEIETSAFYKKMVTELERAGQELFGPFLEIEDGHVMVVQAEIEHLTGLGYWFDFREFDLEAG